MMIDMDMNSEIETLLENINLDAKGYDNEIYGLPIWDSITLENMKESVKSYSRKWLWRMAHGFNESETPTMDEFCSEFIDENELNAKL